jgi:hypothetical protein
MSKREYMKGLTEGRIVHYVIPDGPKAGEHRPAVIVKVWDFFTGYVNLHVLWDGGNDAADGSRPDPWVTSVSYSEEQGPRSWHWIEPA